MFSHLYFKCRQTRGRLRNSPNDCRKLYINSVRSSKRKLDLEKNQFWEYLCLDIQIARAVTALSLTLSTNLGTTCTYNIYIHIYIYIYIYIDIDIDIDIQKNIQIYKNLCTKIFM